MEITLPSPLAEHLTPERVAIDLAVGLYTGGAATMVQAAHVAGLNVADFMQELGRRRIPVRYGIQQLEEDLQTLRSIPLK